MQKNTNSIYRQFEIYFFEAPIRSDKPLRSWEVFIDPLLYRSYRISKRFCVFVDRRFAFFEAAACHWISITWNRFSSACMTFRNFQMLLWNSFDVTVIRIGCQCHFPSIYQVFFLYSFSMIFYIKNILKCMFRCSHYSIF